MDMPIAIPANFADSIKGFNLDAKVADLDKTIKVLEEVWDAQTFNDLEQGKVAVPDDVINELLKSNLDDNQDIKELSITSLENHKLKIRALSEKNGHIELLCKVEAFEHTKDHSFIRVHIEDKKLPDKPLLSWIFSKVSLAMVTKMVGTIDPGQGLAINIHGNYVTLDFHQALYNSKFGSLDIYGYKPVDSLVITGATPEKGYVSFNTNLDIPDNIKAMVKNILK